MSILLDSLRKSEAQRKIGEAPSIYSTGEPHHSGKPGNRWVAWLLIGATAAAIAWSVWQQYAVPEIPDGAVAGEAQLAQSQPGGAADSQQPGATPAPDAATAMPSRTPVEKLARTQAGDDGSADISPAEQDIEGESPADRIAGFVAEEVEEPPMEDVPGEGDGEPVADIGTRVLDPEALGEMLEQAAAEEQGETEVSMVERRSSRSRESADESSGTEPISYWQLPQGVRNDMPEFKITVVVYAESPEDRFLLINGERLKEQEELEGGLVLEEIRRGGAVFLYRSYRFLVEG